MKLDPRWLPDLACPATREPLHFHGENLSNQSGTRTYRASPAGIPLFAAEFLGEDAKRQREHYDAVASAYIENLHYPHTQEYAAYLDRELMDEIGAAGLGAAAEICCGRGEAFRLLGERVERGLGIDVSERMLEAAAAELPRFAFVQGDATRLPLADGVLDSVLMLGGIHHVNDRRALFGEVFRVLKPGGRFYFREPLSDFFLWRALRAVVYRLSPALDHETERPLLKRETVPVLEAAGFRMRTWKTRGFFGFCVFMNSDVLVFNRLFRFVPGIRGLTRLSTRLDHVFTAAMKEAGLQVIGVAEKPAA
jgi:ubiquinone/menaquinone biosynthesis C-methylase UbiE